MSDNRAKSTRKNYVAFLRGINIGGNKQVSMRTLVGMFERMGFTSVRTVLNSGNIIFSSAEKGDAALARTIEKEMEKEFGFSALIIIRSAGELAALAKLAPFKNVKKTDDTILYATFLASAPKTKPKLPYISADKSFRVLSMKKDVVFSIRDLSKTGTTAVMETVETLFGKDVTTRNWNTVGRILKLLGHS